MALLVGFAVAGSEGAKTNSSRGRRKVWFNGSSASEWRTIEWLGMRPFRWEANQDRHLKSKLGMAHMAWDASWRALALSAESFIQLQREEFTMNEKHAIPSLLIKALN